jgi:uncharacterized protein YndB with AHSA1/START domain
MIAKTDLLPMEITTSRLFNVPCEALFDAFADPNRLEHWWGPDGFTNTIHTFDFKPGGTWNFTMHAPNGTDFENTSTFKEIAALDKIVFVHHLPMHVFTMTMTFTAEGTGTQLTWLMQFEPSADNADMKDFIAAANEQNFDRLAAYINQN